MHAGFIASTVVAALGMGAWGVYHLFPPADGRPRSRRSTLVGVAAAAISLMLVAVLCASRSEAWANSPLDRLVAGSLFWLTAGSALAAAVAIVTSRTAAATAVPIFVMFLAAGGLLIAIGAVMPGIMTLTLVVSAAVLSGRGASTGASAPTLRADDGVYEPGLICIAGLALAVVLVGSIRYATTAESSRSHLSRLQTALPPESIVQADLERRSPADVMRPGDRALGKLAAVLRRQWPTARVLVFVVFLALFVRFRRQTGDRPAARDGSTPEIPEP